MALERNVLCGQINLQKGRLGVSSLNNYLNSQLQTNQTNQSQTDQFGQKHQSFMIAIQEPPVWENKVTGLSSSNQVFYDRAANKRPRAALYAARDLNIWQVSEFTSPDMVTCLWKWDSDTEVYVVSLYCDIREDEVFPERLKKLLRRSNRQGKEIIICADTNSHSTLWGCQQSNARGELMEDDIFRYNLHVNNVGSHFTYFRANAQTIIDVTLSSPLVAQRLQNWHVITETMGSDHLLISWNITISTSVRLVRNWRKGDWPLFQSLLEQTSNSPPDRWTAEVLDREVRYFSTDIDRVLDIALPKQEVSPKLRKIHRISEDGLSLRRRMRNKFSYFRQKRSENAYNAYKEARKEYSRQLKREKRASWKEFAEEQKTPANAALFHKIVRGKTNQTLGLIKKDDTTMCQSPEESLAKVIDTHFPGNLETFISETADTNPITLVGDEEATFITPEKVRTSLAIFGDYKAPGVDEWCPCVLKHMGPIAIERLTRIFKASYLLGYVPAEWRLSKVIFLPKPGKKDYSEARSFRPITLSSFMLKTMERIVLWRLNDTTFKDSPLSHNQHAFRAGFSTETALTQMVNSIEEAFGRKKEAMGVFLDIQGAFDNVDPEAIIRCMRRRKFNKTMIHWYAHFLKGREIQVEYKGVRLQRFLTKGVPQGGVLSPVMWNLVFDDLLNRFKKGPVLANGFADDAGLLVTGGTPSQMQKKMQKAVDKALDWGRVNGLQFSANKTEILWFSRKRKPEPPARITMNETPIEYGDTVRYLGVLMDTRLAWSDHVKTKIAGAKAKLLRLRNSMGKLWGLNPKLTRWVYTGIIRPALTYGSIVWARVVESKGIQKRLERLNRLALMIFGNFRRSTPTAGLEIIFNISPLHVHVQYESCLAWYRTQERAPNKEAKSLGKSANSTPHRLYLKKMIDRMELPIYPSDRISLTPLWDRPYHVDKSSFEEGKPVNDWEPHLEVYTDGSGFQGSFGSGVIVFQDKPEESTIQWRESFHLGLTSSVYQGEMLAIKEAADWITQNCTNKKVTLYSDSRSSLLSLLNPLVKSELVSLTRSSLQGAGEANNITLRWIKAHKGYFGNEEADILAKQGAIGPARLPSPRPKPPLSYIKQQYSSKFRALWAEQWDKRVDCRQTKLWFKYPNQQKSFEIINLDRFYISTMVQTITGHNFLKRHQSLVDNTTDNLCTYCEESEETSFHIIAQCDPLWQARQDTLGAAYLNSPLVWNASQIISFLREASIDGLINAESDRE